MANSVASNDAKPDASEVPGAIVIRPAANPAMVYDPETKRVTDRNTGERFHVSQQIRSGGIFSAAIASQGGGAIYNYELKYGATRNADKTVKRVVWQVFHASRGQDRTGTIAEIRERAKSDSIDKLAEFLRAMQEGIYLSDGLVPEGEVVIVDRRMDDTRGERIL